MFRGSLEVITVTKDGRSQVRFVIAIDERPSYLEVSMLERLEHKLRVELGTPAPRPTPKPKNDDKPKPDPDEPKDDSKDERKKPEPKPEPEPPDSNAPVISPTP